VDWASSVSCKKSISAWLQLIVDPAAKHVTGQRAPKTNKYSKQGDAQINSENKSEETKSTWATRQILDKRPPKRRFAFAERFMGNKQRKRGLVEAAEERRIVHENVAHVAGEAGAPIDQ